MSNNIYDKYGGYKVLHSVVTLFYKKILSTDNLLHYFEGIDISKLIEHQTRFLTTVLGGPNMYDSKSLKVAHKRLNITLEDFMQVAGILKETLLECKVESTDVDTVIGVVASYKNDIVMES